MALAAFLVAGYLITAGPPPTAAVPPGAFAFATLGDAPYYPWEDLQYRLVLRDIDAHELESVVQVGDIFWRPCSDERYRRSRDWYEGLRHPVVYTPGDNEWTDCWAQVTGGFDPLERLGRLREIFFADPATSLGGRTIALRSQAREPAWPEFVENARWAHRGVVFATLHIVGSDNGTESFPGRTAASDDEVRRRTAAAAAWTRETFGVAGETDAPAVVLAFHGYPHFESRPENSGRRALEPFLLALEEEVEAYGRPVLAIHGDWHEYTIDHPLVRRTTGRTLDNFTRLQVPGSPDVGWVRVVVATGDETGFAFERRVVPGWKYW